MLSGISNFFSTSPLIQKIYKTAIWSYEQFPLFSSFTGIFHPGITRIKGNIILGRANEISANNGEGITDELKRLSDLAKVDPHGMCYGSLGTIPLLFISKPSHIQQILIDNHDNISRADVLEAFSHVFGDKNLLSMRDGDEWEQKRRALKKWIFTSEALDELTPQIRAIIDEYMKKLILNGHVQSTEKFMVEFSLDLFSRSVFKTHPVADVAEQISNEYSSALTASANPYNIFMVKMKKIAEYVHLKMDIKLDRDKENLEKVLTELFIKPNIVNIKNTPNFLQHYFNTENETIEEQIKHSLEDIGFTVLAGHETTSRLIQFILMLLAMHPEILKELRDEIEDHKPHDGQWTRANVVELHLLHKIIKETLRLFPPAPVIPRMVTKDFTLMDLQAPYKDKSDYAKLINEHDSWQDIVVRAGTIILIGAFHTHRNEDMYTNPDEFNPHRFDNDSISSYGIEDKYKYGYLPFSVGPRDCPGRNIAELEAVLTLVNIITKFNFSFKLPEPDAKLFETTMRGTLRHKGKVEMDFSPIDLGDFMAANGMVQADSEGLRP